MHRERPFGSLLRVAVIGWRSSSPMAAQAYPKVWPALAADGLLPLARKAPVTVSVFQMRDL